MGVVENKSIATTTIQGSFLTHAALEAVVGYGYAAGRTFPDC